MSVVVISGDSYCKGEEIAQKVAQALSYHLVGRGVLQETARRHGVPEEKIEEAMSTRFAFLHRLTNTRTRYLAYFQAAFSAELMKDNRVYHGEVGHMFVSGVSHVLKAHLTMDIEDRTALRAVAEKIPENRARELILREQELRTKWYRSVFGGEGADPARFDLTINVSQIGPARAVSIITETVRDVRFQPITYSVKAMQDQELAGRVRASLIDSYSDVTVEARDGDVSIRAKAIKKEKEDKTLALRQEILRMEGVNYVKFE